MHWPAQESAVWRKSHSISANELQLSQSLPVLRQGLASSCTSLLSLLILHCSSNLKALKLFTLSQKPKSRQILGLKGRFCHSGQMLILLSSLYLPVCFNLIRLDSALLYSPSIKMSDCFSAKLLLEQSELCSFSHARRKLAL